MGVYLSLVRPPLDVAVDALAYRMDRGDLLSYVDRRLEPAGTIGAGVLPNPFRVADLWKSYGPLFDVLSGKAHDPDWWTSIFLTDEFDDPGSWAVYGARKAGWEPADFPLRYSMPSDVEAIVASLRTLTEAEVRAKVDNVLRQRPEYEGDHDPWLQEQVMRALPDLKAFYEEAQGANEIVLYLMG